MQNQNRSETINLSEYAEICSFDELKDCEGKKFIVNNVEVAVFKVHDEIFVLDNICPHQHSSLIYDGFIEKDCVVCPAHGWMFDLRTGRLPSGGRGLNVYPVHMAEGIIYAKVIETRFNW